MQRKRKIIVSMISALFISVNFSFKVPVKAEVDINNVTIKVEEALKEKNFFHYMMAYNDVINLPDSEEKNQLINKLTSINSNVWTEQTIKAVNMLKKVSDQKDGKTYAETEAYLESLSSKEMDESTKRYLLDELTSWGKQFVFTDDYINGLNALNEVYSNKTVDSVYRASIIIGLVKNEASKEYLLSELNNAKAALSIKVETEKDPVKEVSKNINAVVKVEVKNVNGQIFASGSGFIVNSGGVVVTNYHVIEGSHSADIVLEDESRYTVKGVIDYNKDKDIAVLKIDTNINLPTVKLGDSDKIELADKIVAIGSPKGLQNTISTGIISGLKRTSLLRNSKDIQFSAGITNGSSGGALFNLDGEVIGVTYAGVNSTGDIGFAIPINEVKSYINDKNIITLSEVSRLVNKIEPPTGLSVKAISQKEVLIQWDPVEAANYYHIYYSYDNENSYEILKDASGNAVNSIWYPQFSAILKDSQIARTSYFKVTAVKDGIESNFSESVSASTLKVESDKFSLLSTVPHPKNIDYTAIYISDNRDAVSYGYEKSKVAINFLQDYLTLLKESGWSYEKRRNISGITNLYYSKENQVIYIAIFNEFYSITGRIH